MKNYKNTCKRLLSLVLAVIILATSFSFKSNATPLEFNYREHYSTANELCEILWNGYNRGEFGSIIIMQGTLNKDNTSYDVYIVNVAGTEFVEDQATGILQDVIAGFQSDNNEYTQNVMAAMRKYIPENANVVLSGHSLGGMVCQLIAANSEMKNRYNILNTITFGSPVIKGGLREGTVIRLGDTSDFVPYLSVTGQIVRQVGGLNREDGGYTHGVWTFEQGWEAHCNSYVRSDVWGAYDVLGVKNGTSSIDIDINSITYEKSKKTWTWKNFLSKIFGK